MTGSILDPLICRGFREPDSNSGHHDFRARCHELSNASHRQLENPVTKRDFGPEDGETRTRTGDTTIFSRAVGAPRECENSWKTCSSLLTEPPRRNLLFAGFSVRVQEMAAVRLLFRRRGLRAGSGARSVVTPGPG